MIVSKNKNTLSTQRKKENRKSGVGLRGLCDLGVLLGWWVVVKQNKNLCGLCVKNPGTN